MRSKKHVASVAGLFFLVTVVGVSAAKPPVTISTLRRALMAPLGRSTNVVLVVRMEKHEKNWELEVSCDGMDGGIRVSSGKSFWNDEKQAEIYDIGFTLPSATYRCEAVLKRKQEDGKMREFKDFLKMTVY